MSARKNQQMACAGKRMAASEEPGRMNPASKPPKMLAREGMTILFMPGR